MTSRCVRIEKSRGPITWHEYAIDGKQGTGVTTALGKAVAKPGLLGWYAWQGALWAMQQGQGLDDYTFKQKAQKAPDLLRDQRAKEGTTLHAYADALGKGETIEPESELAARAELVADFLDRYRVKVVASEMTVWHPEHMYAGTLDVVADLWIDDHWQRWLLDYKTGAGVYPEVCLQLAAYRYARWAVWRDTDVDMAKVDRCGVVHVTPDGWSLIPVSAEQDAFDTFLHCLHVARWLSLPRGMHVGDALPTPELEK